MPRYRQLHTRILDSDDFNEMPNEFTRLSWVLLPLILDGEGRGYWNMAWLRNKLFPKREDLEIQPIRDAFNWFVDRGMVVRYTVEGREYFWLPTFKNYQTHTEREAKSVIPAPLTDEVVNTNSGTNPEPVQSLSTAYVYESESVNESESLTEKRIFSIRDAEKAICKVTNWVVIPSGWFEHCEKVLSLLQNFGWDTTISKLETSRDDWRKQKRKDNGDNYKLTNPTWITNAIAGETISPKQLTREERISRELAALARRNE